MADRSVESSVPHLPIEELRFVVVGAYVVDCFINTSHLPEWGRTYEARSIRTSPGGKALNQAVALARLGAQVSAVGVVGDDAVGRDILATLKRERVDVNWMETREGVATTVCACFVGDEGESAILWHIDNEVAVAPETVHAADDAIARADAVLLTFELPATTIRETINLTNRHGARVFLQAAPPLAGSGVAATLPWDRVDVLVANEAETKALLDGDQVRALSADDLASKLAAGLKVPTVVVTLGESGCVANTDGITHRYTAHETAAVDTTGAGDAFMASFAAHLAADASVHDAINAAQTAAAWAIGRPGGHDSMPA